LIDNINAEAAINGKPFPHWWEQRVYFPYLYNHFIVIDTL